MSARKFLQRNCDNAAKLKEFAELIWLFFKKMFFYNRTVWNFLIKVIGGRIEIIAVWLTSTWTKQEKIDNDRYLIKPNGPERFFAFTYDEYGT